VQSEDTIIPYDGQTGADTAPFPTPPDADGDEFQFGISFAGLPDFAGSIVAKTFGMNSETLPSTADNTDIYRTMYRTLFGVEPEEVANSNLVFGTTGDDVLDSAVDANFDGAGDRVFAGPGNDLIDTSSSPFGQNRVYGQSGNDEFIAATGDRLIGGEGDDRFFLTEESGATVITGNAGADQFWIATVSFPSEGNTITDFTFEEDVLGIAGIGATDITDLDISQDGDNTAIAFGGNELAILLGVDSNALTNSNFAFV